MRLLHHSSLGISACEVERNHRSANRGNDGSAAPDWFESFQGALVVPGESGHDVSPATRGDVVNVHGRDLGGSTQFSKQVSTATTPPGPPEPSLERNIPGFVEFLLAALLLSSTASVIATVFRKSY
mgnify:CR=1 FL=1